MFTCMNGLSGMYVCTLTMCMFDTFGGQQRVQNPWNSSYGWCEPIMCLQGVGPRFFARATIALNLQAISLQPKCILLKYN